MTSEVRWRLLKLVRGWQRGWLTAAAESWPRRGSWWLNTGSPPRQRLRRCVHRAALRGEGLAYAVIVEPMDLDVDQVRLDARARLAGVFAGLIEEGIAAGELPEQDARLGGAAIVGAFLEGVVAPLAGRGEVPPDRVAFPELPRSAGSWNCLAQAQAAACPRLCRSGGGSRSGGC